MFTAENFRRIFDSENRKGLDVAGLYFPHLDPMTHAIRDKVAELRKWRKDNASLSVTAFESGEAKLKAELTELKAEKSEAIDVEMEKLSADVAKSDFKLELSQKTGPKGKPVYCIDGSPATFFVVKQLQWNIYRIYKVKQSNRQDLACRVRDTIGTGFPFEFVRTDVSDFYESIDRDALYRKLDSDQLLSSSSKRFIRQIFTSYETLSGNKKGIPRGVGISAYLAELFLRPVDHAISELAGAVLYCRYVDDIFAVFARPPSGEALGSYKGRILAILSNNGLVHNAGKTAEFDLGDKGGPKKFDYLGYSFTATLRTLEIEPTDAKIDKLRQRLESTFLEYWRAVPTRQRQAFREILARVKFLTGNARLKNSKSSATTGIYYNNPLITNLKKYEPLDTLLKKKIQQIKRPKLRFSLNKYRFKSGFEERRFHNFSSRELQTIVKAWNNV
ncbi:antiviral reverse transcriptase Drt3a [Shinella fusca]|uniref:Reverse transcriptase domain-containing protein n=1 Tax=Shinella fusca TaxID=544480 RepID=A0A7W7YWD9_9HYPH|nr:antiviral reverse transcriptase Drt3a [Shinella fusca]MBB5043462.1 hypothetical protein [Shinella fusca]